MSTARTQFRLNRIFEDRLFDTGSILLNSLSTPNTIEMIGVHISDGYVHDPMGLNSWIFNGPPAHFMPVNRSNDHFFGVNRVYGYQLANINDLAYSGLMDEAVAQSLLGLPKKKTKTKKKTKKKGRK